MLHYSLVIEFVIHGSILYLAKIVFEEKSKPHMVSRPSTVSREVSRSMYSISDFCNSESSVR